MNVIEGFKKMVNRLRSIEEGITDQNAKIDEFRSVLGGLQNRTIIEVENQAEKIRVLEETVKQFQAAIGELQNRTIIEVQKQFPYLLLLRSNEEEIVNYVNSIFSYCINEAVQKRTDVALTEIYQYYKKLHDLTAINRVLNKGIEKVRIGREHDGGYVMVKPFSRTQIAYSLGVGDDVSWDKEMADNGYQIYQYDHTIEKLPEENEAFHWRRIGITGLNETDKLKHLDTIICEDGFENQTGMLLKMDIEGYEWDLFNSCSLETLNQFDQIVIEIHSLNDLTKNEIIIDGLERLMKTHTAVHIHGNNYRYATFCGDLITPDALELTLIKRDLYQFEIDTQNTMRMIDQVNRGNTQDIWIGRW